MFGSGFAEFISQLPPIAVLMFCLSGLGLVAVITASVIQRGRKMRRLEAIAASAAASGSLMDAPPFGRSHAHTIAPISSDNSGTNLPDLPDLDDLTAPTRAGRSGAFSVRLADGTLIDAVEVLTVLRDVADGTLLIQLGDRAYRYPNGAAADPEIVRRLATLRTALGSTAGSVSVPSTLPTPVVPPVTPPILPAASVSPTKTVIPGQRPGDLPKFKIPDQVEAPKRFGRPKRPDEVIPEINIAAAIEEYLQYKLLTTNPLPGRTLHIRSANTGGIVIEVDGRFFEAVGDVDDPAVRSFLQQAIQEWQDRQG